MNAILFFALMWVSVSTYSNKGTWMVVLCMWVKFNISGTFVVSYLQVIIKIVRFFLLIFAIYLYMIFPTICKDPLYKHFIYRYLHT